MAPDDGSKDPEPEGPPGQPEHDQVEDAIDSRLDGIVEYVESLEESIDGLRQTVVQQDCELERKEERIIELEQEFRDRIEELEERTDMLRLVEQADAADGKQRSQALLQHLKRKAQSRQRDGHDPVAVIDAEAAEEALHHPDVHRTTIYSDMERVERLIGDKQACRYKDGELRLDLTGDTDQHSLDICGSSTTETTGVTGEPTAADGGRVKQDTD